MMEVGLLVRVPDSPGAASDQVGQYQIPVSIKGFTNQIIEFSNGIVQLSSVYNICAIKSMIVLEMKCPQLSKPEATAARNENSIGDRMEKKPWEKPGSVGGPVPLRPSLSPSRTQEKRSSGRVKGHARLGRNRRIDSGRAR